MAKCSACGIELGENEGSVFTSNSVTGEASLSSRDKHPGIDGPRQIGSNFTCLVHADCFTDLIEKVSKGESLNDTKKSVCFIATAAFGSPLFYEVRQFRSYREQVLFPRRWGRRLIRFYERSSPPIARIIASNNVLRLWVRKILRFSLLFITKR